jgi:hypothetical protein
MSFRRVWILLSVVCLLLPACSSHSLLPTSPTRPQAFRAAAKTFGVGLSMQGILIYNTAPHEHDYCQTKGHKFDDCPSYVMGKKSIDQSGKGSGKDRSSGAKVSFQQSATSRLGAQEYAQQVTTAESHPAFASAAGQVHFGWEDVLHVKSGSHPNLTPVTIWFALTVKPSKTSINCKYDPTADLEFEGTGTDKNQSVLDVTGKCMNGKFTYTLDNGNGAKGLKDVGYENTSVGANLSISGSDVIRESACVLSPTCPKKYSSNLAGAVTWKIVKISPKGVSVSSDSGTNYMK